MLSGITSSKSIDTTKLMMKIRMNPMTVILGMFFFVRLLQAVRHLVMTVVMIITLY